MKRIACKIGAALLLCVAPGALAADQARGERLFGSRCASCHGIGPSARGGFGPPLGGLYGRRAGSAPDYRYSPAMARSAIVWNDKTLAAFLAAPDDVVPGNKMRFWGMGNAGQVADLLAYLRSVQAPGRRQDQSLSGRMSSRCAASTTSCNSTGSL